MCFCLARVIVIGIRDYLNCSLPCSINLRILTLKHIVAFVMMYIISVKQSLRKKKRKRKKGEDILDRWLLIAA